jgi:mannan endo-1,4-beta-mannosidase
MIFKSLLAASSAALCVLAPIARAQTADPGASPSAKAVLGYIRHLADGKERRVLSGQFLDFAPNVTLALPETIHEVSGKWPAYIGVDYTSFRGQRLDYEEADRVAVEYWRQGGLVEVNTHLPNPTSTKGIGLRDKGVRLADLLTAGSPANIAWLHELDTIAEGLGRLQDAGVVVMWRPFHEMNGGWFWWGAKPPADFVALWRHMFTYFTETKHLHNLIWLYSPNMGPSAGDYYPGDAYTDMVGLDAYTDSIDSGHIKGFAALLKTDKPVGFGEYGPHGASKPPGDYDYTRFGSGLAANFPQAVFFMAWNDKWSPARNLKAREFYNDPSIVTRSDLPAGLGR